MKGSPSIAILFAESLAGIEVAWSLCDAGLDVVALTRHGRRPALGRSSAVRVLEITPPERDARRSAEDLRRVLEACSPVALMPLEDSAVMLCESVSRASSIPVVGPTGEQATLALDKQRQLHAAERAGLQIPKTSYWESPEHALGISDFPIILKPRLAVTEHGGRLGKSPMSICADRAELTRALRTWPVHQPLIAQQLVEGVGEGLFGLATADGVCAWSAHRRVRMMNPHGSGSSACMATPVDPRLASGVEAMLVDAGWRGIFMAEFLRGDDGRAWFLELNGRPWGSTALARRMGLEYPAWAVKHALDPDFRPPPPRPRQAGICRHVGRELVHLLFVFRGPKSRALTAWPSRAGTLRDILHISRRDSLYNWRRGELRVFLWDAVQTVVDQVLSRKRRRA